MIQIFKTVYGIKQSKSWFFHLQGTIFQKNPKEITLQVKNFHNTHTYGFHLDNMNIGWEKNMRIDSRKNRLEL